VSMTPGAMALMRILCLASGHFQADVSDRAAVHEMIDKVLDEFGQIDLLVNNAGAGPVIAFDDLTPEQWDKYVSINLTGPFNMLWAVKEQMIARKFGRIVNIASIAAFAVRPTLLPYAAAKAGVISFTKSCCEPLARHNIRINAIAPGVIDTEILNGAPDDMIEMLVSSTPIQRLGKPEEIAQAVCFLLSEKSSYVTGTTLIVSGGRLTIP